MARASRALRHEMEVVLYPGEAGVRANYAEANPPDQAASSRPRPTSFRCKFTRARMDCLMGRTT